MSRRGRDLGVLWHLLAGVVLGGLAALVTPFWLAPIALALFGVLREMLQHDISLTLHQWVEGLAWPTGGLVGGILVAVLR